MSRRRARTGAARRRTLVGAGAAAALAAWVVSAGCNSLEPIEAGICGNGVVEHARGEDCDCFDDKSACTVTVNDALGSSGTATCKPAGAEGECRFACNDSGEGCLPGWGCGSDGICRASTGRFKSLGPGIPVAAQALLSADFDGDGHEDLMAVGNSQLDVMYHDEDGSLGTRLSVPSSGDIPAVGALVGNDGIDDFVFSSGRGVAIFSGQSDRSFSPLPGSSQIFPLEAFGATNFVVSSARVFPVGSPRAGVLSWLAVVAGTSTGAESSETRDMLAVLTGISDQKRTEQLALMIRPPPLAGRPVMANLGGGQLSEVVVALLGQDVLRVYSPDERGNSAEHTIGLSAGAKVAGGPFVVDVNGDALLDVLVGATCPPERGGAQPTCLELEVAYGTGTLAFGQMVPYGRLQPAMMGETSQANLNAPPLAVGDLDRDGHLDVVVPDGVGLGVPSATPPYQLDFDPIAASGPVRWTEAVIGDLNGNDVVDVVAGSASSTDLTFLNGVPAGPNGGYRLNTFRIPTRGGVSSFAVGDFDGDLLPDLAFAENAAESGTSSGEQALSVCFGRFLQAPEPPARMGEFTSLFDVAALASARPFQNALSDVGVIFSLDNNVAVSIVEGTSSRLLTPVFPLTSGVGGGGAARAFRSFAGRFEPEHLDFAAVSIDTGINRDQTDVRLWLLPTDKMGGGILLDEERSMVVPDLKTDPAFVEDIDGVACNLDEDARGDTRDELVLSLPEVPNTGERGIVHSALVVAHDLETGDFGALIRDPEDATLQDTSRIYKHLRAGDLDGDHRIDIVGIAVDRDRSQKVTGSRLVIFWNDSSDGKLLLEQASYPLRGLSRGDLLNGLLDDVNDRDPKKFEEIGNQRADDLANQVLSFDFANLAITTSGGAEPRVLDAGQELVLLTHTASYVLDACDDSGADCLDAGGGRKLRLRSLTRDIPGGAVVARCDVQGDGVDDLAVLKDGALRVYEGAPLRR